MEITLFDWNKRVKDFSALVSKFKLHYQSLIFLKSESDVLDKSPALRREVDALLATGANIATKIDAAYTKIKAGRNWLSQNFGWNLFSMEGEGGPDENGDLYAEDFLDVRTEPYTFGEPISLSVGAGLAIAAIAAVSLLLVRYITNVVTVMKRVNTVSNLVATGVPLVEAERAVNAQIAAPNPDAGMPIFQGVSSLSNSLLTLGAVGVIVWLVVNSNRR